MPEETEKKKRRPRKKKLQSPMDSIEAFLSGIQEELEQDAKLADDHKDKMSVTERDKLQSRLLQGLRVQANAVTAEKKMNISLMASAEWRELKAKLARELAQVPEPYRSRILEILEA